MKKVGVVFLLFIGCLSCTQKIYIGNSSSVGIKKFMNENNLQGVDFIYQNTYVTNDNYDEEKLIRTITKLYPETNQKGIAVLDWEGVTYDHLVKDQNTSNAARIQFEMAIKKAKALRPNVKWSFYGLPTRNFWAPNQNWKNKNLELLSLFSNFDFIAPSVYLFYPFSEVNENVQNNYIDSNIQLAKKIGKMLGKPVYPIVSHRYHPSYERNGNQLAPEDLFGYYTSRIRRNGIRTIIWWQSEEHNYRASKENEVFEKDYPQNMNKDQLQEQILNGYYNSTRRK